MNMHSKTVWQKQTIWGHSIIELSQHKLSLLFSHFSRPHPPHPLSLSSLDHSPPFFLFTCNAAPVCSNKLIKQWLLLAQLSQLCLTLSCFQLRTPRDKCKTNGVCLFRSARQKGEKNTFRCSTGNAYIHTKLTIWARHWHPSNPPANSNWRTNWN